MTLKPIPSECEENLISLFISDFSLMFLGIITQSHTKIWHFFFWRSLLNLVVEYFANKIFVVSLNNNNTVHGTSIILLYLYKKSEDGQFGSLNRKCFDPYPKIVNLQYKKKQAGFPSKESRSRKMGVFTLYIHRDAKNPAAEFVQQGHLASEQTSFQGPQIGSIGN